MTDIMGSFPRNVIAAGFFVCSLLFILWYAHRQAKIDEDKENKRNESLRIIISTAISEQTKTILGVIKNNRGSQYGQPKQPEPPKQPNV